MTLVLPPGQQHERTVLIPLLEQGSVKRQGRERPRLRPRRVVGDKGYSRRGSRRYRTRNQVERLINRCKQWRRLATRYDKRAGNYRAFWLLAATIAWL